MNNGVRVSTLSRLGLWPLSVAWYGILYSGAVSVLAVSGQSHRGVPLPRWQPRLPQFVPRLAPFARGGNNNTPINTWSCVNSISINGHSPPAPAGPPTAPLAPGGAS